MLRNLIAISVAAISLFAAQGARADWLMIGAYDFQPYDKTTQYTFSGGRGGYVSGGFTSVKAPVRVPIGKSFTSLWCQVLDISSTANVSFTLGELSSTDNASDFGETTIMSMSTTGSPGYVKISTSAISGSPLVKTFTCGSVCTYYTYYLTVSLPGTSNTSVKSCAIEYN